MEKKFIVLIAFILQIWIVRGQDATTLDFIDASSLTVIGQAKSTAFPFHRLDTAVYKGLSKGENQQARCPAGLALVFRTNASQIDLYATYKYQPDPNNMTRIATAGFDLYIKKDGQWLYANSTVAPKGKNTLTLIKDMDTQDKECLLYLPLNSELDALKIGVPKGAKLEAIPNPFQHKLVIFGSSYTQGISANRPGMNYPAQLERNTGLYVCNLGFSGNSKLQPYFARYLADVETDAFIFDAFSNPNEAIIRERLFPFIETIRAKQPNTPLIFVQTIYRESGNFNLVARAFEEKKRQAAEEMMEKAMKKYKNVYFINNPQLPGTDHATSTDGVHPSDLGYSRWAKNLGDALLSLFKEHQYLGMGKVD
ncbi:SGNH/GDSL hydrolase family protein [Olivibacter ginsenosidimutans]|uniref:SGNH/GDSL hydrolase family protein n=1 Tax=Olivibacter ginsenosidimutans TaxID=1176537 RepID=A0ABP9BX09_9SPHI